MIGSMCSPLADVQNDMSCFNNTDITNIMKILIKSNVKVPKKIRNSGREIKYKFISQHMENTKHCKKESCWINQKRLGSFKNRFLPLAPPDWMTDDDKWLDTDNINAVLNQYKKAYPKFYYYGAVPMDFDNKDSTGYCTVSNICKMSITSLLKKGFNKIGIVFNTDKSTEDGEHWISLFIDLEGIDKNELLKGGKNKKTKSKQRSKVKDKKIYGFYYFDSVGDPAPKQVLDLFKRLNKQMKKKNKKLTFFENDVSHQMGNNECGVYSIYFIVNMLNGRNYFDIIEDIKRDKEMNDYRKIYFRSN